MMALVSVSGVIAENRANFGQFAVNLHPVAAAAHREARSQIASNEQKSFIMVITYKHPFTETTNKIN